MRKNLFILPLCMLTASVLAQDFDKNISTARSSYSSGHLQDARFAMEQILRDLDIAIGKEVLKLLPTKIGALAYLEKQDNVTGTGAYTGLYVNRNYGTEAKRGTIEIINNSPLITSLNAILSMPVIGGMVRDENQKIVRLQGYKAILNKTVNSESGKTNYELQIPMNNTLLTLRMDDSSESEVTNVANSIPLAKIVQVAQ